MWTRLRHPATDEDGVADPVLKLTAIILLLRSLDVWWVAPFVLVAACLSLVLRGVRRAPVTWVLLSALVAIRIAVVWPAPRSHRLLVAKAVLSPDYVEGRFFRVTLLTDERFSSASLVFGGLSRDQMAENRKFLEPLPEGAELLNPPAFVEPPRLRVFASTTTWGGLALEALVALLCLMPAEGRTQVARHAALLIFCATTYALAPVAGFGWLIATMGLAQCRPNQQLLRGAYIAAFVMILLYSEIPWTDVLAEWTAR